MQKQEKFINWKFSYYKAKLYKQMIFFQFEFTLKFPYI
jgi:hypothetical protein